MSFSDGLMPGLLFAGGTYLFFGLRGAVWAVILKHLKLSVAYPALSLSFPLVLLVSYAVFREHVSLWNIAGAVTVVAGVVIISRGEAALRERKEGGAVGEGPGGTAAGSRPEANSRGPGGGGRRPGANSRGPGTGASRDSGGGRP
jgi:multidrug transporter EmrE-like cation transporter